MMKDDTPKARSFVFSTGNAPHVAVQAQRAAELIAGREGDLRRDRLWSNAHQFAAAMSLPTPT